MEWRKLNEHISSELEMNPELGIIRAILMKSYDGLPYHLKSCFLYMSIFPGHYSISRRRLVHRWKAEGYSSEVRGKSKGEIADGYFLELIERSLVLPYKESIGSRKGISSCKLHDLMREISISKAMEENLVFRMEEGCSLNTQGTIRHLAISSNWEGDQSEFESIVDLSHISLKLAKETPITADMEREPINRRDVCTFYCCVVFPFLARLADPLGVAVPRGLRKLKALHTLGVVNIARGKAILQDIKRLTRLRKLAVTGINKKNCKEFCSTLVHLSSLESLSVHSKEEGLGDCLDGLSSPPKNIQSLNLYVHLDKLPEWVSGLQNLVKLKLEDTRLTEVDGTIRVLGKLSNLSILCLLRRTFEAEGRRLSCRREAFPSLTALETGWYTGIRSVLFEEGTAPKLELLLDRGSISFSGLSCLPSLKEVMIRMDPQLANDVQYQLSRNPNKPVLKFV
ncbi:unnamed protein product [Miscanthus lutarioriparius]|uniref:Uncharacterized protein n=1 Tax=Miscanthus lutarioriparius TaxID=422564 RepID=A0A811NFM0_9POAL|nr:unnamed protein product [Miscanthus lutarioriparius]